MDWGLEVEIVVCFVRRNYTSFRSEICPFTFSFFMIRLRQGVIWMMVQSLMVCPVKQPDGTWTTEIKEFEEDIPDKGRHTLLCNKCSWDLYPECMETCPVEKNRRERLEKGLD